jgi:dTDP-glucose 4,6-dehydratase
MKILVTGGAGFIGSNFIRYMLDKYDNCKIVNLDLLTYAGNLENLKDIHNLKDSNQLENQEVAATQDVEGDLNYKFVKGDIADRELVNKLFEEKNLIM